MFSESSRDQNDIFCVSADFFGRLLWRTSKIKFLIASMTSLTNGEISSNPIQEARSSSPIATCNHKKLLRKSPVILKIVSKAVKNQLACTEGTDLIL